MRANAPYRRNLSRNCECAKDTRMPIAALLDTDLGPKTVSHELRLVPQTGLWANAWVTPGVWTPVRRRLSGQSQEASDAIYGALGQMAGMAKNGDVTLYDSDETFFESLYVKPPELRGTQFDVLRGIKRKLVRGPLRRTYVIGAGYSRHETNDRWLQLLAAIQHPRFLELKKRTGGHHLADLYHVWTAEENSLDCFLTLDTTFLRAVTLPKPLDTPVRLLTPMQFVRWVASGTIRA
jgi:hypothetical protein